MEDKKPFVSVIIPCRNEKEFIRDCLESIIAQDYPKDNLEFLVVDGMSEDGTRDIIRQFSCRHPFIKLIDNPRRITPCAINTGIKNASGEVIIRMDAHAVYKEDYISKCVKYLFEYRADNVGGVLVTRQREDSFIGRAIARALSNSFGVGNSIFRTGAEKPVWVDTVFGGCYKKEIFDKVGLFNEDLIFSQDIDFNQRLKRAGGRILLHPDIKSYYYARSRFMDFCRYNFKNGVWITYPLKFVKTFPFSLRHIIPLIFASSLIILAALSPFFVFFFWLFICISGFYFVINIFFSAKIAMNESDFRYLFIMPVVFFSLHFLYGLGSIWGIIKLPGRQRG